MRLTMPCWRCGHEEWCVCTEAECEAEVRAYDAQLAYDLAQWEIGKRKRPPYVRDDFAENLNQFQLDLAVEQARGD